MGKEAFCQFSETDPLRKVVIGRWEGYAQHKGYVELVNESQKKGLPSRERLKIELTGFKQALEEEGVEVIVPEWVGPFVYDQLTPRDIGITIGHRFLICNMKKRSRRYEIAGLFPYLNEMMRGDETSILIPDDPDVLLEGGDILLDRGRIYAGLSQRTNQKGIDYLSRLFEDSFEVVPLQCRSLEEGQDVLHLDCALNFVGEDMALIYPDGLKSLPEQIEKNYRLIEVTRKEQEYLATNVLSLDKDRVIARKHANLDRVNQTLRDAGLKLIEVVFDATAATGGSVRCGSMPLVREKKNNGK